MKKTLFSAALLIAAALGGVAMAQDSTPDGCMPGNGGSAPICTPGTGPGGK